MKFSTVFAVACAALPVFGAAVAVPAEEAALEERASSSLTALTKTVNTIIKANNVVDADALAVDSSALGPLLQLYQDSITLNTTLTNQTAIVKKQTVLNSADSKTLSSTVSKLVTGVQKVSKDIIAIKSYAAQAGVQNVVLSTLQSIKKSADTYSIALATKVSSDYQATAKSYRSKVDTALNNAIKAYSS